MKPFLFTPSMIRSNIRVLKQTPLNSFTLHSKRCIKSYSTRSHFNNDSLVGLQLEEKYQTINYNNYTAKLHYVDFPSIKRKSKRINQKTLICVHGAYQTSRFIDDFVVAIDELKDVTTQDLRIISIDQRGHGKSSFAEQGERYDVQLFREDLRKFIEANKIDEYYLLGASLGGMVALDLAATNQSSKANLGLITLDIGKKLNIENIIAAKLESKELSSFDEYVTWAKKFNPIRSEENLRRRLEFSLKEVEPGEYIWRHDPRFNIVTEILSSEINGLLQKVKGLGERHRILLLRGENSPVTSPSSLKELQHVLGGKTTTKEIPDSGHSVAGDNPKNLAKVVLEFMEIL